MSWNDVTHSRGNSKKIFSDEEIRQIHDLKAEGMTNKEIAKLVGRTAGGIGGIIRKSKQMPEIKPGYFNVNEKWCWLI